MVYDHKYIFKQLLAKPWAELKHDLINKSTLLSTEVSNKSFPVHPHIKATNKACLANAITSREAPELDRYYEYRNVTFLWINCRIFNNLLAQRNSIECSFVR